MAASLPLARAHEHHDQNLDLEAEKLKPIDTVLWLHIYTQALIWAVVFPFGMVLGLSRSRWHVPVQLTATVVTMVSASFWRLQALIDNLDAFRRAGSGLDMLMEAEHSPALCMVVLHTGFSTSSCFRRDSASSSRRTSGNSPDSESW